MFTKEKAIEIKNLVFDTIGYKTATEFEVTESDGVFAEKKDGKITVGGKTIPMLARAFFLSAMKEKKGETEFKIEEKAHFSTCGMLIDVSRNAVLKVSALKRYINYMVSLGMNAVILYMEDVFTLKEYPYFGYMRGRYSIEELKEIDDYAHSLGVEVIAHIEALGHLKEFLHWGDDKTKVKSATDEILLVDDDSTYAFIETMMRTLKKTLRTNRIFTGTDEAPHMIEGKYYDIHGPSDFYTVLMRHIKKISEISEKVGYTTHYIDTDVLCRYYSPTGEFHDVNIKFDDKLRNDIPENTSLVYWNYGKNTYDIAIKEHLSLNRKVMFMGGGQNWFGYLPWHSVAVNNAHQGLKACFENGIDFVVSTIFGDDGCETNHFLAINDMALYSEYCYKGRECTKEDIYAAEELISGITEEDALVMFDVNLRIDDNPPIWDENTVFLKDLFYSDIMYDIGTSAEKCEIVLPKMQENVRKLAASPEKCGGLYEYAYYIHSIITMKAELRVNLRKAYKAGDTAYILNVCDKTLPELLYCYDKLYGLFKAMWHRDYKPFGLEVITKRFGGFKQRLTDLKERFENYLNGGEPIYELEEEVLPTIFYGMEEDFLTPSTIK